MIGQLAAVLTSDWCRLSEGGKDVSLSSFKDKTIKTGLPILHLVDVITPGEINWSLIDKTGTGVSVIINIFLECSVEIDINIYTMNVQANLDNAKYAVSIARKVGAPVYALPEDISEVRLSKYFV